MEKLLHDVLNAGIALFRAGEDSVSKAISDVQSTYDQLKEKGASDTSDAAVRMRNLLDDIVSQANDLSGKAGSTYTEGLAKLEEQYTALIEQVQKVVPQDQIDQIKDKLDELTNVIKEKVSTATSGGSSEA